MSKLLPAILALSLFAGPALAQGTAITPGQSIANAPGGAPKSAPVPAVKPERTAKSKDCSTQADQQGLHGKARKVFRSKCKAGKV